MLIPSPGSRIPQYVSAVDAHGKTLFENLLPSKKPSHAYLHPPSGVEVLDRLLTSGNEFILSTRASQVLANCDIDPAIARCPIIALPLSRDQAPISGYKLWYSELNHDILHEYALTRKFKGRVLSVFEWVAAIERIPNYDLFLGLPNQWFVSERFVDLAFENRLSGFGFALVPCFQAMRAEP